MSTYHIYLEKYAEFGVVEEISHPVVVVTGLPSAFPGEVVIFENNVRGQVMSLDKNKIEVLVFAKKPIRKGTKAAKTGMKISVPVGEYLLGMVIDPLGKLMTPESGVVNIEQQRPADVPPKKITERAVITEPLNTGVSMVDLLLPLGKGQREVITGDLKTGKSSFVLSVIKNQIREGSVVVYAAIGKRSIEIEQLHKFFVDQDLMKQIVFVAVSSMDAQSLIFVAPFTAMTVGEYFAEIGRDAVVILDDLSTHAKYYREISLLAKRFPGRDSYPGDIFYTHARLLERAGNFKHKSQGETAVTCLPISETLENDLTDYIVSNLISITDGHLLFDSKEFVKGRRPAVNPGLSVTRVGKQTRTVLHQDINQHLLEFLSQYSRSEAFSHFGSELTDEVKSLLGRGNDLYAFFLQGVGSIVPSHVQYVMVALIWLDTFPRNDDQDQVIKVRDRITELYLKDEKFMQLVRQAVSVISFDDLLNSVADVKAKILEAVGFVSNNGNNKGAKNG